MGLWDEVRTFCVAPGPEVRVQMDTFKLMIAGTGMETRRGQVPDQSTPTGHIALAPVPAVSRCKCAVTDRVPVPRAEASAGTAVAGGDRKAMPSNTIRDRVIRRPRGIASVSDTIRDPV